MANAPATARPRTVEITTALLMALIALGAVTVAMTVALRDDLIRNWAYGHREAREILARQGLAYLKHEQPIAVPQFVPVASVLFVVVTCLILVLTAFFRLGHGWARFALATMVVLLAIGTGAGIRIGSPTPFEALSWISLPLDVAIVISLFVPATAGFVRDTD